MASSQLTFPSTPVQLSFQGPDKMMHAGIIEKNKKQNEGITSIKRKMSDKKLLPTCPKDYSF